MGLADVSIRRPVFAWMLMFGLLLFGGISFVRLGVSQLPDVDFPVISISLTLEGATPEVMESDVVDIVEDVMTTVEGVREISSTCREGRWPSSAASAKDASLTGYRTRAARSALVRVQVVSAVCGTGRRA